MSSYSGGRKAPNVSQYIANLNTIPSSQDISAQDNFDNLEDDMALFTNTEFFDFDLNEVTGISQPVDFDTAAEDRARGQQAASYETSPTSATFIKQDFQFPDFNFHSVTDASPADAHSTQNLQQTSPITTSPINRSHGSHTGDKRKLDYMGESDSPQEIEEASRLAAEEDKRRRNTAASARFRIKKKQREQALEKTAKEMTEKVTVLENRVQQLEMENKWLKGLITEKNEKADIGEMLKQFTSELERTRSKEDRKDGVGTSKP